MAILDSLFGILLMEHYKRIRFLINPYWEWWFEMNSEDI